MYCKNCGQELPEDAKFCQKCGNAVTPLSDNSSLDSSMPEQTENNISGVTPNEQPKKTQKQGKENILKRYINRYFNRWKQCKQEKFKGRKNIWWTVANAFVLFVVIYNFAMCFYCNRDLNGLTYYRSEDGTYAYAMNGQGIIPRSLLGEYLEVKQTVKIGFKTYTVKSAQLVSGGFLHTVKYFSCALSAEDSYCYIDLDAIPKAEAVTIYADRIYVSSRSNPNRDYGLASLTLISNKNYNDLYYKNFFQLCGDFPNLTRVYIKEVEPSLIDFTAEKLTDVELELSNGYLLKMINGSSGEVKLPKAIIYLMEVPNSNINITHTIEDLYGTWTYRDSSGNEVFTVTFQENGYVRISDGLGIIGIDLFTFSEVDNNTLLLKAETADSWGELLSFNMPYELYGKELQLSIYGNELDLVNEDTANEYY